MRHYLPKETNIILPCQGHSLVWSLFSTGSQLVDAWNFYSPSLYIQKATLTMNWTAIYNSKDHRQEEHGKDTDQRSIIKGRPKCHVTIASCWVPDGTYMRQLLRLHRQVVKVKYGVAHHNFSQDLHIHPVHPLHDYILFIWNGLIFAVRDWTRSAVIHKSKSYPNRLVNLLGTGERPNWTSKGHALF
jgi:hypothetical protein